MELSDWSDIFSMHFPGLLLAETNMPSKLAPPMSHNLLHHCYYTLVLEKWITWEKSGKRKISEEAVALSLIYSLIEDVSSLWDEKML